MSRQLSLFPAKDERDKKLPLSEGDGHALDEVLASLHRFRSSREYLQMLQFIGRFPQYSALNGFLLYIQNPDATYVATAGIWKKRFKRNLKPGARPLLILAPMSPVRFVFDLNDTEGAPLPDAFQGDETVRSRFSEKIFENTVYNCAFHGIMVRQVETSSPPAGSAVSLSENMPPGDDPDAGMNYLILLYREHRLEDKYAALVHELGQIFCGHRGIDRKAWWSDRRKKNPAVIELEAASLAFLVCRRIGLFTGADRYISDYRGQERMLPLPGFSTVLQAANYIEEMGRSRWQKPRKSR